MFTRETDEEPVSHPGGVVQGDGDVVPLGDSKRQRLIGGRGGTHAQCAKDELGLAV